MICRPAFVRPFAPLLALTLGALSVGTADASEYNEVLDIGDPAPAFENLPTADGKTLSLKDLKDKKAVVVVFTCNHCPVAKAYEGRMKEFAAEYGKKDVALVALSVSQEPEDELSQMTARAKEQGFNFPYARDESQAVGKAYGATVTPQTFVLGPDMKVRYMGAWDDSWRESKPAEEHYVRDAVDAVLAGEEPAVTEKRQVGCGIVYE
ncbi:thioredoxin family protein [Alienimonas sp. DA493]|uniref:thioredoxin family protein n=1 Tax=Alienimonas sp. DA493 TaxID=3373605 RepID=UPI003754AC3F